jgi:predicted RNA-binding protein
MCEANVYIDEGAGRGECLYLENVDIIRPEDGKLFIRNLFGEQKLFDGQIKEISLIKHRIVLTRKPAG